MSHPRLAEVIWFNTPEQPGIGYLRTDDGRELPFTRRDLNCSPMSLTAGSCVTLRPRQNSWLVTPVTRENQQEVLWAMAADTGNLLKWRQSCLEQLFKRINKPRNWRLPTRPAWLRYFPSNCGRYRRSLSYSTLTCVWRLCAAPESGKAERSGRI